MNKNFRATDWKSYLPKPVCAEHPEYEEFYTRTWEIARDHVRSIPGMPQDPYMDEAFCDTQVWIWDTCFMSFFCKFAQEVFPGVETFNNFYQVLYGGGSLPQIIPSPNEPWWTSATPGVLNPIYIHIADNPPLFAWGEYENAILSGDVEHIKELLCEKQFLQKHYEWFESLRGPVTPKGVFHNTCLIKEELGYRWEGGRSGMDNTPRGRSYPGEPKERPQDPNLLWLDAICQQALSARLIAKLFRLIGDEKSASVWEVKFLEKKDIVNRYYWDDEDGCYYDIDVRDNSIRKVLTVASYWALTAGIADEERARRMAKWVSDPETLGGKVPLLSLARNDGDYKSDGRYWRGSLWLPTAYAALKGLSDYGYHKETHEAGCKIFNHMLRTYHEYEPHTVWECYSPEECKPAVQVDGIEIVRKDFCGWSALGPISIYIEYVLGFHSINAFEKVIEWEKPDSFKGEIGVRNLRFGDIVTDVIADGNECRVRSNAPYTLKICGKAYEIKSGENIFEIA